MAILINRDSKFITCGFTGHQGTFHSLQSRDYGSQFVGGVTPGKGGTIHEGFPVFNTVSEAKAKTEANAALIFVPPANAADSIVECIEAEIALVVCITDGIPTRDMTRVKSYLDRSNTILVGPNTPGVITPGESKLGIMPGHIHMPGKVGVISRSGTLSYDIVQLLSSEEIGQSTCVGIGADPISGTNFIDILKLYEQDDDTEAVLIIGEIGGISEAEAARWAKTHMTKPIIAFMAGAFAPRGKRMGHSGAIINDKEESVADKVEVMKECGVHVVDSIFDIPSTLKLIIRNDE
ncbi:MAG: succinate--CoA ligase subunit alpha [Bacteriovoracaceae bacterium]|nr:succinate--CoA ligase subunit alpha [Bacteriovoracaceae bacterium]